MGHTEVTVEVQIPAFDNTCMDAVVVVVAAATNPTSTPMSLPSKGSPLTSRSIGKTLGDTFHNKSAVNHSGSK